MPSSRTRALNVANYPSGQSELPSTALPDWANSLGIEIQFCTAAEPTIWPDPTTTIRLIAELSINNGPWVLLFDGTQGGGIQLNKFGVEIPFMNFDQPLPSGTNRRIRGSMDITNGPCRTTMFISLDSESHVFRVARR